VSSTGDADAIRALLAEADAAFAAGDADRYTSLFADDGRLYVLHGEPAVGREAIRARWARGFERFDTSAWEPSLEFVDVDGDVGCAFETYTERLLERATGERTLVRGRLAYFVRRDAIVGWRITLLMNSHSHPMERIR
jgi:uncharacterized protein (TIGR02246 family)